MRIITRERASDSSLSRKWLNSTMVLSPLPVKSIRGAVSPSHCLGMCKNNLKGILAVVRRTLDVVFQQVAASANVENARVTFHDLIEIRDGWLIQIDDPAGMN